MNRVSPPDPELGPQPPTETEGPQTGGAAATASPVDQAHEDLAAFQVKLAHAMRVEGTSIPHDAHAPTCPLGCCTSVDDPAVTGVPAPLTAAEFDSIVAAIWEDLEDDQFRVGDLLADALGFIAGIALREDTDPHDAARAAAVLRAFEQRALWGPDHEQEDHR